ncbi:MAG: WYL domain-containing protein [Acidimicrobiales bacterium]
MRVDGSGEGREALWKLGGMAGDVAPDGSPSVASLERCIDPAVTPKFEAITTPSRHDRFGYRGEQRTIDPWRLHFQRGRWYVSGFDQDRQAERNFRIGRIDGDVDVLGDQAWSTEPPEHREADRALQGWELGEEAPTPVEVVVDTERVAWLRQELGPNATERPATPSEGPHDSVVTPWVS